jgi:hypothetical protein
LTPVRFGNPSVSQRPSGPMRVPPSLAGKQEPRRRRAAVKNLLVWDSNIVSKTSRKTASPGSSWPG